MITLVVVLTSVILPTEPGIAAQGPPNPDLALKAGFEAQYQNGVSPVSRAPSPAILPWNHRGIAPQFSPENALVSRHNLVVERRVDRSVELAARQYHQSEQPDEEQRLMLGIGAGLGVAYIVFLACWLWATRLRSRPPRH